MKIHKSDFRINVTVDGTGEAAFMVERKYFFIRPWPFYWADCTEYFSTYDEARARLITFLEAIDKVKLGTI
jgi:hypothetical protein